MTHRYRPRLAALMRGVPTVDVNVILYHYLLEILIRNNGNRCKTSRETKIKLRTVTNKVNELITLKYPVPVGVMGPPKARGKSMKIGRAYAEQLVRDNKAVIGGIYQDNEQYYVRVIRLDEIGRVDHYRTTTFNALKMEKQFIDEGKK